MWITSIIINTLVFVSLNRRKRQFIKQGRIQRLKLYYIVAYGVLSIILLGTLNNYFNC